MLRGRAGGPRRGLLSFIIRLGKTNVFHETPSVAVAARAGLLQATLRGTSVPSCAAADIADECHGTCDALCYSSSNLPSSGMKVLVRTTHDSSRVTHKRCHQPIRV